MVFINAPLYSVPDKYYNVKINQIASKKNNEVMITIVDASHQILCNNEKSHNELLKTINATVNHELRNPLNSIVAYN